MSKSGMNNAQAKHENNPYKKDNRPQNNTNDKRGSGHFSKLERQQQSPMKREHGNPTSNNSNNSNNNRDRSRNDSHGAPVDNTSQNNEVSTEKEKETTTEKKFTGRCRLFVGNLTPDISEAEFRKMFEPFGEISEVYVNTQRAFGFIRLDYRPNAEAAKAALDGTQRKGRILRVRFATHGAALRVKNLHPFVSNELLEQSFSQFGELERCIVIVDDRGKSTGEGIVEFVRKPGASSALRRITEGVFLFGIDPKPIAVEPLEQKDEEDGMPEKFLTKTDQYKKEREKEPRFAPPGTFEYEFGMRWKQLEELEKQRIEQVKKDTEKLRLELEDEMQNALYDYQAEQIRQDLMRQQEELRRLEELRNNDRMRRQQDLEMRRQKDERDMAQQEERRREMIMRQQEMAQRRGGGMDPMRSREEMMMAERYGDRMDRMGDRMPERMGERMGQGGPGFNMWQDEQRNEAQMKGMRGNEPLNRGRDMRGGPGGAGGPGSQQPGIEQGGPKPGMERSGPPSLMERGGPQPGMEHAGGPQPGMERGPQQPGMERGQPGMDRGQPGMDRGQPGMDRGQPGMDRGQLGMDRGQPGMDRGQPGAERGGAKPGMDRSTSGPGAAKPGSGPSSSPQGSKEGPKPGPKPLIPPPGFNLGGPPNNGPNKQNDGPEGNNMAHQRRQLEHAFDQFQNPRNLLGNNQVAGALGVAAAAAAMAASRLTGHRGMGGNSPNMFQGNMGNMNERMMMERRREAAAREELHDIKRMRRY